MYVRDEFALTDLLDCSVHHQCTHDTDVGYFDYNSGITVFLVCKLIIIGMS